MGYLEKSLGFFEGSTLCSVEYTVIRTDDEFKKTLIRLNVHKNVIAQQKANMKHLGLNKEQIERAIQPSLCFHDQLKEEIEVYAKLHRGDFDPINDFSE